MGTIFFNIIFAEIFLKGHFCIFFVSFLSSCSDCVFVFITVLKYSKLYIVKEVQIFERFPDSGIAFFSRPLLLDVFLWHSFMKYTFLKTKFLEFKFVTGLILNNLQSNFVNFLNPFGDFLIFF